MAERLSDAELDGIARFGMAGWESDAQALAAELLAYRQAVRAWVEAGHAWLDATTETTDAEYAAMRERDGKACAALRALVQADQGKDGRV